MTLDDLLQKIDVLDAAGPGARDESGKRAVDLMEENLALPGALQTLVERYSSSSNPSMGNNLAFLLGTVSSSKEMRGPDSVNLIYHLLEHTPSWSKSRMLNNALNVLDDQALSDMPWFPLEEKPPVFDRFLLHCIGQPPDDENDNAASAVHVLWDLHLWTEDRGGLRSVFSAEERQAFRDKFDEVGLDPGPILKSLGED